MRFQTCLIPAGGKGTRMGPGPPKCLREVNGKPLVQHVVDYWRPHVDNIVVLGGLLFPMPGIALMDDGQVGLVSALNMAVQKVKPEGPFVVSLGDCLLDGTFAWPLNLKRGVGVLEHEVKDGSYVSFALCDWARSYTVAVENGRVCRLIEKPHLGMGIFVLDEFCFPLHGAGLMEAIGTTADLMAIPYTGRYLNVTYPEDLSRWG